MSDEFTEREKPTNERYDGDVTLGAEGNLYLKLATYKEMGEPQAARLLYNGRQIGIKPCDPDHSNAYLINGQNISAQGLLETDMGITDIPTGGYELTHYAAEDMWVLDLDD